MENNDIMGGLDPNSLNDYHLIRVHLWMLG